MRDTVTEGLNSRVIADFSAPIASASSVVGMDKDAELVELLLGLKQTDRPARRGDSLASSHG